MVRLDVDSGTDRAQDMFDGLEELRKWYSAPTLLIFKRTVRKPPRNIDLNPQEMVLDIDDVVWIEEGLKIIENRKKNSPTSILVYSSSP